MSQKRHPAAKRIRIPLPTLRALDELYKRIPVVKCQGLCVDACSPLATFLTDLEFDRVLARSGKEPNGLYTPDDIDRQANPATAQKCNMLKDGRCTVYDARPAVCRLYGAVPEMACPFGCEVVGECKFAGSLDF